MTHARATLTSTTTRRALLGSLLGTAAGVLLASASGCSRSERSTDAPDRARPATESTSDASVARPRVLLAYFSRPGENYYYGDRIDLAVGNTEVLAGMIRDRIGCDVYRIEAVEPYSDDYDETVTRNTREQAVDARPGIVKPLQSIEAYDTVVLASPIWNVRPPRIMRTFVESLDFTDRPVHPVTTHAMSGLGTSEDEYAAACRGATLGEGLAVRGEEVADAGPDVDAWLSRVGLT
ncbi:hypothetical protein FE697_002455 [Mumia zhuanghuii]|uniref:Flavodoxin n=2 Tax=Mumia TaxID=1546255 RepID=A0ABW1QIK3_9ACTN|nr:MULTISPECIES: flavodoxin [Mumia]KAA1424796.1 hypothetical protein FE697_002455 [Mumia zhuanghuii]